MGAPSIVLCSKSDQHIKHVEDACKSFADLTKIDNEQDVLTAIKYQVTDVFLYYVFEIEYYNIDFVRRVHSLAPNVMIAVLTETPLLDNDRENAIIEAGAYDVIAIPMNIERFSAKLKNILKLTTQINELTEISNTDALTGVASRYRFNNVLRTECDRALRNLDMMSLIMLDIDYFKSYNDLYGHLEGDTALVKVATAIKQSVRRPGDLVARFGGEEFIVILPSTNMLGTRAVIERIQSEIAALEIQHIVSDVNDYLTVSIGSVTVSYDQTLIYTPQLALNLLNYVDKALYAAKEHRNTYVQREIFYADHATEFEKA